METNTDIVFLLIVIIIALLFAATVTISVIKLNAEDKLKKQLDANKKEYDDSIAEIQATFDLNLLEQKKIICSKNDELYNLKKENYELHSFIQNLNDNITAFPFLAGLVADINTYGYEKLASQLDWGHDQKRLKKVQDIREIRRIAKEQIEQAKEAEYQLKYLFELYPALEDVIECHFEELPKVDLDELNERDRTKDYLSKEEWESLSTTERNQLALDRYINSHNKTKWQIGRDYENYIGYLYEKDGYSVDYFGSYMGLGDLGRDLIVSNLLQTTIIQCKYWSSTKKIHEKHITQLYGTMISYCIENNMPYERVSGMLVTNIELSETAKKMANYLGIQYKENLDIGEYPRIKCNIGHDEFGFKTKIYHLPFDQQYDSTKIKNKGEFFAMTVEEAEKAGFRRAFKWFGQ